MSVINYRQNWHAGFHRQHRHAGFGLDQMPIACTGAFRRHSQDLPLPQSLLSGPKCGEIGDLPVNRNAPPNIEQETVKRVIPGLFLHQPCRRSGVGMRNNHRGIE